MALLNKNEQVRLVKAIKAAETNTSGEIRLHVQNRCKEDIFETAQKKFEELGMSATELRHGVLIFMALKDKKFAILGDSGINELVPDDFWQSTVDVMTESFKQKDLVGGLEKGILKAGDALKEFFPYQSDDINELSDEISFDEE
jgi:uncharacterized membrane protein